RMGRKVLNLIVWVGKDNDENEKVIRKIAYSAIQNFLGNDSALSDMIQESIDFYEREEFRCDLTKVNDYVNKLDDFDSAQNPNFEQLIDIKSDDYLTRLAEDIKKYSLPKQWKASNGAAREEGVLVVVTEQLDQKDIFYQAEVWRGFASNVEKPSAIEVPKEVIISLPSIKTLQSEEKKTTIQAQSQHKNRRLIYLMIIMVIFILIVIMAFQTMRPKMLKPSPQKTPISQEKWHPPLIYPINRLNSEIIHLKV
ncbi:MAG: hypothetical protein VKL41_08310, partial [Snowella sp.]|nr:hypothetical protein [Snowella sp.]